MTDSAESKRKGMCINCGVMTRHRIIIAYAVAEGRDTWAYVCETCEKEEYF